MNFIQKINVNQGIIKDTVSKSSGFETVATPYTNRNSVMEFDSNLMNEVYKSLSWVYRCVNLIATKLASVPLKVVHKKSDDTEDDISDRPEFAVLYKPNQFTTRYDFWYETFFRLEIQGELFWEQVLNAALKPIALYADWKSSEVEIVGHPTDYISKYVRTVNGTVFNFEPQEVIMVKYHNPDSLYRGLPPLQSGKNSVILELNAVNFLKKWFEQGLKVPGFISHPNSLSEPEANRLRKHFKKLYGGVDKMHEFGVLWGGTKFVPVDQADFGSSEMQKIKEMTREEIAGIYGLLPEVLGFGKDTFENMKEARRMMWTDSLRPKMSKLVDVLNTHFLPSLTGGNPDIKIKPDYSNIEELKGDMLSKSKIWQVGVQLGSANRNEYRQNVLGMDAVDDPEMNDYVPQSAPPSIDDGEVDDI